MARDPTQRGRKRPQTPGGRPEERPRAPLAKPTPRPTDSSRDAGWDAVSKWYDKLVGDEGSDYHREVILPAAIRLLQPLAGTRVLDVCCGQGVLARWLAEAGVAEYVGVDASPQLIDAARKRSIPATPRGAGARGETAAWRFEVADVAEPGALASFAERFDAAACIMAVHDVRDIAALFCNVATALRTGGRLVVVGLHPCFRIPRQSSWGWDEARKAQYRRLDRYQSAMEIPISTHPGRGTGEQTVFYHRPLRVYAASLAQAGFSIVAMDELLSHRRAAPGGHSRGENRAAEEFPIFLALVAEKG